MKTCYITTPIYYASGKVHIGNAYSTIACDVLARYNRLLKNDTFYLTGMDEHGQKIEQAAKKNNQTPQEFVDNVANETSNLWKNLNITNDYFIRTTDKHHVEVVQKVFEQLLSQDDIYLSSYEGPYCVECEAFFTKTQIDSEGNCPDCGRPTTIVKEESYFLRLKKYEKKLLKFIEDNPDFIQPSTRRNEVISFIEQGLEDLCVSRTTFKWGIEVKSNPKHVVYVWIDALMNYLTALGYSTENDENYKKYWLNGDQVFHVVGKDILRFHAIYWPIMLMALNVPIKFKLLAHGWILMKEGKMSKSKGNTVYPMDVANKYGLDALRLYVTKEMPFGNDGLFTYERFVEKYNVYLANDLGNLVSRTISMITKYFNSIVMKNSNDYTTYEKELKDVIKNTINEYHNYFSTFQFQNGLNSIWTLIGRANKYIDETTPWVLAKDDNNKEQLNCVMYNLYEVLRVVAIMISPVMPDTSKIIFDELGVNEENRTFASLEYGKTIEAKTIEKSIVLFKRLDPKEELKD